MAYVSPLELDRDELLDAVADAAEAGNTRAAWLLDELLKVDGDPGVMLRLACRPYVQDG